VDVVALVASAGGLDALSDVLSDLPMDFPVPVVVQKHLGGHASVLTTTLARRSRHDVGWRGADAGAGGRVPGADAAAGSA
jgi:two-component system chemotaxis response regulator CheB